jgi:hypothetical protein
VFLASVRMISLFNAGTEWRTRKGSQADCSPAELVLEGHHNGVNEYSLRWGFEEACKRAGIVYGEAMPRGIICTICGAHLPRVFAQTECMSMTFRIFWAIQSRVSRRSMLGLRLLA